jgi:hypothetical protein
MTYGATEWRFWAELDMRHATNAAMERLRLMGCPDPEAYLEEAMLALIGAEVERVILEPANDTHRFGARVEFGEDLLD